MQKKKDIEFIDLTDSDGVGIEEILKSYDRKHAIEALILQALEEQSL